MSSDNTTPPRAGQRIRTLPPAAPLTGDERVPISQNGSTRSITISELMAWVIAQHQSASAPHSQYEVGDVEAVYIAAQQPGE